MPRSADDRPLPDDDAPHARRRETPAERDDRNLAELLQELRVTQTGVQILFAFLLTLAFTDGFEDLDGTQRAVYVVTLLLAMVATVLFVAPVALHRVLFQRGHKRAIVHTSSRLATAGLGVLALTFTGALLLVVDVVEGRGAGIAVAVGCLVLCGCLWGALPALVGRATPRRPHRHADGRDRPPGGPRGPGAPR
ncbi:DUF6328 family protein [Streptomyces sp. 4N509B]|uniref:DUF6328 family protein n=1 Tax=Streptomyces sp. 4N509B TaxID=3457413 RepID=UPI003FD60B17